MTLVFSRSDDELGGDDKKFVERDVTRGLGQIAGEENSSITSIHSIAQRGIGALLLSPDKKATIVLVQLNTPLQDARNVRLVGKIEKLMENFRREGKMPAGLEVGITGSATAGRDLDEAEKFSAQAIEIWTITIVVILLLILFRAPLIALVPLVTVFVAVGVSLPILSLFANWGLLKLSRDLRVFIVVLVYGAGVDYCVFLIARYREELENGGSSGALAHTIEQVGTAITASAATVICGIAMLVFAQFGKIHEAGLVIPFALTITLLATLTFTAALLGLFGRVVFWPCKRVGKSRDGFRFSNVWDRMGPMLLRRPGTIWLSTVGLMAVFSLIALWHYDETNFNPLRACFEIDRLYRKKLGSRFPHGQRA